MKTTLLLLAALVYLCSARSITFPVRTQKHEVPRQSRYARNAEAATLKGDDLSLFVNVSIANDATAGAYYSLLVDTGSQITAFTGSQVLYNIPHKFYGSNTSNVIPCNSQCKISLPCNTGVGCNFSQSYLGGQAISGYFYSGSVILSGVTANNVPFGVISVETGGTFGSADGIMGLARVNSTLCASAGVLCFPNLVQAFDNSGAISSPNFGIALDYQGNGQMVIGADDPSLYVGSLTYFPMYGLDLYYTAANSLFVGNTDLGVTFKDFGDTIFDTGSSYILLPNPIWGKMVANFQAKYSNVTGVSGAGNMFESNSNCFPDMRDQLPPIIITIEATQVIVSPYAYMYETIQNFVPSYCLGIASLAQTGDVATTVLGLAFLRGRYFYHDVNNSRIGVSSIHANVSASSSSGVWTTITSTTGPTSAGIQTEVNVIMIVMMVALNIVISLF